MTTLTVRTEIVPLLDRLQLEFDRLIEVARYADRERSLCTKFDPKGHDLIVMNAKVARGLREMFCGPDWEVDETDNQPGIKNAALKVRVIPCNLDRNAGNRLVTPTNRSDKGSASSDKVRCNATADLFEPSEEAPAAESGFTTYILGTYFAEGEYLRAELSLPTSFAGKYYTAFSTRLILLDGSDDGMSGSGSKLDRGGPTEIVDIAIKRK